MNIDNLPDDIEKLKAQLLQERRENEILARRIELLEEELRLNRQKRFGRKSEKAEFDNEPGIFDEVEEWAVEEHSQKEEEKEDEEEKEVENAEETVEVAGHKRAKRGRKPLPDHLPHKIEVIELPAEERMCECGEAEREIIGYSDIKKVEHVPEHLYVRIYRQTKYGACKCCKSKNLPLNKAVVAAPMPESIMPGSIASPSLLAAILTGKFVDGLPFYRMEKIYARHGLEISRTNMCNWAMRLMDKGLTVLNNQLRDKLLTSPLLGMDETSLQVMNEEGREDTTKSYMWVMRGEPAAEKRVVYYHYAPSRSSEVARGLLENFSGALQTDGYEGYDRAIRNLPITHIGCWAHARRYFMDAIKNSKKAGAGHEFVKLIAELYKVEREAGRLELAGEKLREYRRAHAGPVLAKIKDRLDKKVVVTIPQSLLGKAINYTLGQWSKLAAYIDHPEAYIDNNLVENTIRPFVIGRKNWLFSGSPRGAYASAAIYSLIESAKANDLEPYWYLRYLFENLVQARREDSLAQLLPTEITVQILDDYFNTK